MPAKSRAELRFLFAKDKRLGKKFADETPDISALPEYAAKPKKMARALGRRS